MLYIQKDIKFWNTEDILPVSYKTGTTPEEFEEGAYRGCVKTEMTTSKSYRL